MLQARPLRSFKTIPTAFDSQILENTHAAPISVLLQKDRGVKADE